MRRATGGTGSRGCSLGRCLWIARLESSTAASTIIIYHLPRNSLFLGANRSRTNGRSREESGFEGLSKCVN